jgi:hypothetical protein
MPRDFFPSREADIVTWTTNFKTLITATPTAYGLTAAQATAYGAKSDDFIAKHQAANDPSTRSPSAIVAKDVSKAVLAAEARMLARIVQATPSVTAEQKSDLGLTVRDVEPSPIPPPAFAPGLDILSAVGNTVRIRLHDSGNPTRRGKPDGVAGASVFSFVGATPPAELADWKFEGNITRTTAEVVFPPATPAGSKVWVVAAWYNPRAQRGPACAPVATNIPGGAAQAA